jgi:hypothetical protein
VNAAPPPLIVSAVKASGIIIGRPSADSPLISKMPPFVKPSHKFSQSGGVTSAAPAGKTRKPGRVKINPIMTAVEISREVVFFIKTYTPLLWFAVQIINNNAECRNKDNASRYFYISDTVFWRKTILISKIKREAFNHYFCILHYYLLFKP